MSAAEHIDRDEFTEPSFQGWRERFLRVALISAVILASIAFISTFFSSIVWIYEATYAAAYAALLLVTFLRAPYWLRSGVLLAMVFAVALTAMLNAGIASVTLVFFLTFIVLSGLLYSPRAGLGALVISIIPTAIVALLALNGLYQPGGSSQPSASLEDWLIGGRVSGTNGRNYNRRPSSFPSRVFTGPDRGHGQAESTWSRT